MRPLQELAREGKDGQGIYEALVIEDIQRAADVLEPVYQETDGRDGYVSLEVSPLLAHDAEGTIVEATRLWETLGRHNTMIKVPATSQGLVAIEALTAAGINVNVTLIFSRTLYQQVALAFLSGLEIRAAKGAAVDRVASVASFFVSRIDVAVDHQLQDRIVQAKGQGKDQAFLTSGQSGYRQRSTGLSGLQGTLRRREVSGIAARWGQLPAPPLGLYRY